MARKCEKREERQGCFFVKIESKDTFLTVKSIVCGAVLPTAVLWQEDCAGICHGVMLFIIIRYIFCKVMLFLPDLQHFFIILQEIIGKRS